MGDITAIVSGKGGTGRTSTAVSLGAALAARKTKTLLIDLNFGTEDLPFLFGAENRVVYHLLDVIEGNCKIIEAMVPFSKNPLLQLLPASVTRPLDLIPVSSFVKLTAMLRDSYDCILIDTPAGVSEALDYALQGADAAMIVTTSDYLSVKSSKKLLEQPGFEGVRKSFLVNRFNRRLTGLPGMYSPEEAAEELGLPLLGIIPETEEIFASSCTGEIADDKRLLSVKCFDNTAGRLLGEEIPINIRR